MQNCHHIILLTYYSTYGLQENNNKIYCRQQGCLLVSETGDAIDFRQQLSTTSFEACELEITVNYFYVYT